MNLESAYKMRQIAEEYIESCNIDDELVRNIKDRAKQGEFTYWVQGELDELTKQKLECLRYIISTKRICGKIITRISW